MKRQWETEELIEQFTLMPSELALLPDEITNATPQNRLGFAGVWPRLLQNPAIG